MSKPLSLPEAAAKLGVSWHPAWAVSPGNLGPVEKIGRTWIVSAEGLETYLAQRAAKRAT